MRYQRRLLTGAIGLFSLVGVLAPAAVAQAQPEQATRSLYAPSALVLSFGYGEDSTTVQRAATLRCEPQGGDHPAAAEACTEIASVNGNFAALTGSDRMCTKEYQPVTVTVSGVWRGRQTSYRQTFSNRCTLLQAKGSVFEF